MRYFRRTRQLPGRSMSLILPLISVRSVWPGQALMTRISDGSDGLLNDGPCEPVAPRGLQPRILVLEADRALLGLLEEWLGDCGCVVDAVQDLADGDAVAEGPFDLLV